MAYRVLRTAAFRESFAQLAPDIRDAFGKKIARLPAAPFSIGKPLGFPSLRELRVKGFRVYYLVSRERIMVLLCDAGDKKQQRATVDRIISEKETLLRLMENYK